MRTRMNRTVSHCLLLAGILTLQACSSLPTSRWAQAENDAIKANRNPEGVADRLAKDANKDLMKRQLLNQLELENERQDVRRMNRDICEEKSREGIFLDFKGKPAVFITELLSQEGRIDTSKTVFKEADFENQFWIVTFVSSKDFVARSNGREVKGTISDADLSIPNEDGKPLFSLPAGFWGGGWRSGDSVRLGFFNDEVNACGAVEASRTAKVEEGGFRVKYLNKPVLAILDELAYKRRFSYTVHSDLSPYRIDIYDENSLHGSPVPKPAHVAQRFFRDERELVEYLVSAVNLKYFQWNDNKHKKLAFAWDSDGPRFFILEKHSGHNQTKSSNSQFIPICSYGYPKTAVADRFDTVGVKSSMAKLIAANPGISVQDYCGGFKKVFLNNITSSDANALIGSLFLSGDEGINVDNKKNVAMSEYKYQNALIIRSTDADLLKQIGSLIYAYDSESPQILIEAFVYQYTEQIGRVIGSALEISRGVDTDENKRAKLTTILGPSITSSLPQLFFGMTSADMRRSLLMTLAAQDTEGLVKIVAEPKLVSKSGSDKATIKLTQKKFIEIRGVNAAELKEIEAGLELRITPTILGGDNVLLSVYLNQSEFIPTTETQVLQSTNVNQIGVELIVKDGELTSLGAVESTKVTDIGSGLSGFKDLGVRNNPLLGQSDKSSNTLRVEFMIRPHIRFMKQKLSEMKREHLFQELITQ